MNIEDDYDFIATTIEKSLGLPPAKLPAAFHQVAWNLPRWHLLMLQDRRRMEYYSDIIKSKVAGKIVLDVGTGSGILSHLALKWGAKKVYSVEENPALQAVYKHLMQDHLKSGKAHLICDDAKYLRLEQFNEGPPQVILHELFGSIGMGENLIPIFRALKAEGILTDKTGLAPDNLEVWMRPVWSDIAGKEGYVKAFEGYPLDVMNIFGCQSFWEQDYIAFRASNWQTAGEAQLLFKCNLHDLILPERVELSFERGKCSHLQIWMKIIDSQSGLIHANDHQEIDTHWANAFLTVPTWLRDKAFKGEFEIRPNTIQVHRFT